MRKRRAVSAGTAPTTSPNSTAMARPERNRLPDDFEARQDVFDAAARLPARAAPRSRGRPRRPTAHSSTASPSTSHRHERVTETECLQHREFRHAFAKRLRHRVAGEQDDREEHGAEDAAHHQADVADLVRELARELRFSRRTRFVRRVLEQSVDGSRHFCGLRRIGNAHHEPADLSLPELARLIEIVVVEQKHTSALRRIAGWNVVCADEVEFPQPRVVFLRIDVGLDRNLVADCASRTSPPVRRARPWPFACLSNASSCAGSMRNSGYTANHSRGFTGYFGKKFLRSW